MTRPESPETIAAAIPVYSTAPDGSFPVGEAKNTFEGLGTLRNVVEFAGNNYAYSLLCIPLEYAFFSFIISFLLFK